MYNSVTQAPSPLALALAAIHDANKNGHDVELAGMIDEIGGHVNTYLLGNGMVKDQTFGSTGVNPAMESYNLQERALDLNKVDALITAANVPACYHRAAKEAVTVILHQHLGCNNGAAWTQHNMPPMRDARATRSLTTLFDGVIANAFNEPGMESFGMNIDMAVPDMKTAITISLLRFRTNLVPRMLPVRGTSQPNVTYIKENLEIYQINSVDTPTKRIVDLYFDPSMVLNELKTIVPLKANDASGADAVLVSDGVLMLNKTANIIKLSLNAADPMYASANRTDIVADNAAIAGIYLALTATIDGSPVTESFYIEIPDVDGTLTRPTKARDVSIRTANFEFPFVLESTTKTATPADSVLLAAAGANEGIRGVLTMSGSLNLKDGETKAMAYVNLDTYSVTGAAISGGLTSRLAAIKLGGVEITGYKLAAKFSEENLRKTDIAMRSQTQPYSFDIPTGRSYVYDYAIGQTNAEDSANNLSKMIRIGQDGVVLASVKSVLSRVYNLIRLYLQNPVDPKRDPGIDYVAGAKVRPWVFSGQMDFRSIVTMRDADRTGDIKARAKVYLNAVVSELKQKSGLQYEIAGALTFKMVTSPTILGNIIGQPHIHNHLGADDKRGDQDGVEYLLVLDDGTRIEVITTTFNDMYNQMYIIPSVPSSIESELNYGHNWDYGTMVGHYTATGNGVNHRLFSNIRELPVPTNPVGALITVLGVDKVTFTATAA